MATTKLALEIIAKNRAKKELAGFQRSLQATTTTMKRFGAAALSMVGIASVGMALKSVTAAAMIQETAVADLTAAMRNNSDQTRITVSDLEKYAAEMQRATIYGDELILSQMAYAKNLGVTTDKLKAAAKAAIGLAAKYRIDLQSAMMLIGRASQGQTQMLTRYGIVLDESLTAQEKFNAVLRIGADSFHLAEAASKTSAGQFAQFENTVGDLKEELGKKLLPVILGMVKALNESGPAMARWASDMSEGFDMVTASANKLWSVLKFLPGLIIARGIAKGLTQDSAVDAGAPSGPVIRRLSAAAKARQKMAQLRRDMQDGGMGLQTGLQIPSLETRRTAAPPPQVAEARKIVVADKEVISSQRRRMLSLIQQVDIEIELLGRLDEPRQHARMMVEFQAAAAELYGANIAEAARETELFRLKLEELGRAQRLQRIADGIGDSFGRAFEDMALGAAKASEAIRALTKDVMRLLIRQQVTEPLSRGISGFIADVFTPQAAGPSMLAATGPKTFASGGVFDRPTLGIFGEAGPETILPLTRGPGGKLGVSASGGAPVNVTLKNETGIPMRAEIQRISDRDVVVGLLIEDFEAGGATADMFGGG